MLLYYAVPLFVMSAPGTRLQQQESASNGHRRSESSAFTIALARHQDEVREAQRLRYQVFAEEMGARLTNREAGIDSDQYDPWCDHLIVRDRNSGRVIGTYRILNVENARRLGGFYADEEFDLTRLDGMRGQMVEVGRACVHREYRSGAVIALLWSGVARYMARHGYGYLIGCANISLADGGAMAAQIYHALRGRCLSPAEYRVFPKLELPMDHTKPSCAAVIPPLIKGYVHLGAYVCGAPAWDPDFNTADLFILLPMARLSSRYARRFAAGR